MPLPPEELGELWRRSSPAEYAVALIDDYVNGTDPGSDEDRSQRVAATLERGAEDYAQLTASTLERFEVTHLEVRVSHPDGTTRDDAFAHVPTPIGLLLLLTTNCQEGSEVEVTQYAPGGTRTAADTWPFDLGVAEDLVRPLDGVAANKAGNCSDGIDRRVRSRKTRFGVFLAERQCGPPSWRWPKLYGKLARSRDGQLFAAVGVGWRLTGYRLCWLSSQR